MTWKVLTNKTCKILYCSEICSALDSSLQNLSIDPLSTTDFELSDCKYPTDTSLPNIAQPIDPDATDSVFFCPHGEKGKSDAQGVITQKFKSVMKDQNRNDQRDADTAS